MTKSCTIMNDRVQKIRYTHVSHYNIGENISVFGGVHDGTSSNVTANARAAIFKCASKEQYEDFLKQLGFLEIGAGTWKFQEYYAEIYLGLNAFYCVVDLRAL